MEHWWEIAISCIVVVLVSMFFNFENLPTGGGKLFAYFGLACFPTLIIQLNKLNKLNIKVNTSEFIFALTLNTFLVLFFSMIIITFIF